ncbi:hypothetical protein [Dyadobacter psychrophilus]|uniref:Uncharacterized protein n=1 Tax=Dyadobacter psychrophilus TaxID=651661 RepID=A0A1T5BYC4_9BACT|nr:hypothetical protein [Dyadobacter psychrophilus]SKB52151.1 hypothetical protein SAMN05660293_00714 [Dyadobacter psychrophilus]
MGKFYIGLFVFLFLNLLACTNKSALTQIIDAVPVNKVLPDDYTNRLLFKNTSIVREDLASFVGSIVYVDTAGNAQIVYPPSLLRASGRPATTVPLSDQVVYESKLTSDWEADVKLALLKQLFSSELNSSGKRGYSVIIQDIASTKISQDSLKWDKVFDIALNVPKPSDTKCRCLIMNSILTNINYKQFTEIDNKLKIGVGEVFAADGVKYNSQNSLNSKDYRLSYWCYDIDKALKYTKTKNAFDGNDDKSKLESISYLKSLSTDALIKTVLSSSVVNSLK